MDKKGLISILALVVVAGPIWSVSPAAADETQRRRLRMLGERAVYVVEGGRNPAVAYKQSDAYDRHNAIAKASALANSTYENRIIVSDILTADAVRFGADLATIGRTLHAGMVMLAGPHFETKHRIPLAIPEGPADRCGGVCLQAFQYCTFQTGGAPPALALAAQINRYLTHNERWCMYWFFRRDLHVAIQDTLHAYQIGGILPAAAVPPVVVPPAPPGMVAIGAPGPLPGGAVPAPPVGGGLARAFSYFGDHLLGGNVTGAGVAIPGPGAAAALPVAPRAKRNTYPYSVIALGTPVSFYSHNPKKPVGYYYDAKRMPMVVAGGPFAGVLPPGGAAAIAPGGAPLGGLPPLPAVGAPGPLCNDFLVQPGHQVPALPGLPGVPGVAGVGGVAAGPNVHPALPPGAPPGWVGAWPPPMYKLYRPAAATTGCSDLDLKIYSPDLTHIAIQEVSRLRAAAAAAAAVAAGGIAAPAAAPHNRVRLIAESYQLYWTYGLVILPPAGATPARTLWLGDPPAALPAGAVAGVAAVAAATGIALPAPLAGPAAPRATAIQLAEFDRNLTTILPLNEMIVDNGKVHVFKNTTAENTGVYQIFPALAAYASTWTLALGREVDLKLEFSLAVPSYVNLPGGPIAVLYEDDPAEPSYRLAALPPRPNPPGGGAPGPGAPGAPGPMGGPGGPPPGPGGPGPAPHDDEDEENNENMWFDNLPFLIWDLFDLPL